MLGLEKRDDSGYSRNEKAYAEHDGKADAGIQKVVARLFVNMFPGIAHKKSS
jgi:hypothetical protein